MHTRGRRHSPTLRPTRITYSVPGAQLAISSEHVALGYMNLLAMAPQRGSLAERSMKGALRYVAHAQSLG